METKVYENYYILLLLFNTVSANLGCVTAEYLHTRTRSQRPQIKRKESGFFSGLSAQLEANANNSFISGEFYDQKGWLGGLNITNIENSIFDLEICSKFTIFMSLLTDKNGERVKLRIRTYASVQICTTVFLHTFLFVSGQIQFSVETKAKSSQYSVLHFQVMRK